jgi:hypothetical protein
MKVFLEWVMLQKEVFAFEDIAVVKWSEDIRMIYNPTPISKLDVEF